MLRQVLTHRIGIAHRTHLNRVVPSRLTLLLFQGGVRSSQLLVEGVGIGLDKQPASTIVIQFVDFGLT